MAVTASDNSCAMDAETRLRVQAHIKAAQEWMQGRHETAIACISFAIATVVGSLAALMADDMPSQALYWRNPDDQTELFAAGEAGSAESFSLSAVDDMDLAWQMERARLFSAEGAVARWFAGFSFAFGQPRCGMWQGWPDGWLVLPQVLIMRQENGSANATLCLRLDPDLPMVEEARIVADLEAMLAKWIACTHATPRKSEFTAAKAADAACLSKLQWTECVEQTVRDIQSARYAKVVLARKVVYTVSQPYQVDVALLRLSATYPESAVFALVRNGTVFVGATPERLLSVRDHAVSVDCLAGTTLRSADRSEDETLGRGLLASEKNRVEHALVLQGIKCSLDGAVTDLAHADAPILKRLANVQHLYTPVHARLLQGQTPFSLVGHLHPTPAVAGLPQEAAREAILAREGMDRGWYAAPIGWIDGLGNADFFVALRSAVVRDNQAELFAGAGITGDSDPAEEWEETEWKLATMRTALSLGDGKDGYHDVDQ